MPIDYIGTHHKCRCCNCGQVFFTDVGNVCGLPEPPPVYRLKPKCPTCGHHAKLRNREFELLGLDTKLARRSKFRTYTEHDCSCGQVSTSAMASELGHLNNYTMALKLHCEKLVEHWKNDWQRSVMPKQMKELQRILSEISRGDQ